MPPPTLRPLQTDDIFNLQVLQAAVLAPDGRTVVYAVLEYDAEDDADYSHLWLLDIATGEITRLTHGKANNSHPCWSPDGSGLAFLSTRSGKPQLYHLPLTGGEARPLTALEQGVGGGPVWSPDGRWIAFTAGPNRGEVVAADDPYRVTRHVYRFDGLGYLDDAAQDLFVIPAEGGDPQQLTDDSAHNTNPRWSPDSSELLYCAALRPDQHRVSLPELRVVNLTGQIRDVVTYAWGYPSGSVDWLPDGKRIAFVGVEKGQPIGTQADLFVTPADGVGQPVGQPENRTAGLPYQLGGGLQPDLPTEMAWLLPELAVADSGRVAYVQVQVGGTLNIYRVALEGPEVVAPILDGERACRLLSLSSDERHLFYTATTFNEPLDLYLADVEGGEEQRLTALNAQFLSGIVSTQVEALQISGQDGVAVEGWFMQPSTGTAPFPTILYIHGGPHSAFGHQFHFDMQMLVGAGYGVLVVNHRASTGYGNRFSTAIKGDWGNLDYSDLMAGIEAAIAAGLADPDRLGVCGLSGGGNLSCWIVGQTDRFKAAVPENPVTNWLSFYGTSDIGPWFAVEQLGGKPHEIPEVYARCSPITYAHRCRTPTLLIQGEHDWRCPAEQSEQFYNVLKANGCVVEMLRLPGSPHAGAIIGEPKLRRAQNEALLNWMQQYV